MGHQLLGVILSGLRRIGNKPGHQIQEVHKETWGKHEEIGGKSWPPWKSTVYLPSHGLSHSLSAWNLSNSESLTCMLACDCSNVCMWVLTSMQEWAWMCMSVYWHVWPYFHSCVHCELTCMCSHRCAYICVLYTYMHVCMHVHHFTYPCDSGWFHRLLTALLPLVRSRKQRNPCSVLKFCAEYLIPDFFPMEV